MGENDRPERRVYLFPPELVERVRAYQTQNSISSEVEAVRRLLDLALFPTDTVHTILVRARDKLTDEKDLRIVARDVLSLHPSVKSIYIDSSCVKFQMNSGKYGMFTHDGIFVSDDGREWAETMPSKH